MKYRNLLRVFATASAFIFAACGDDDGVKETASDDFDVQFVLPEYIYVDEENGVTFTVIDGKAPLLTDLFIFEPTDQESAVAYSYPCSIIETSSESFTVEVSHSLATGQYDIYIKRGDEKKAYGLTCLCYDKIAIACHRGYWDCDEAAYAENSIASLRVAQEYGFWGSEFDIHICTDDVILIYHDDSVNGKKFEDYTSSEFADVTLANGEKIPTFDEYLAQGAKSECVLVCELKRHSTSETEDKLLEVMVSKIKEAGLYDPERIIFISFSRHICEVIAQTMPEFTNQYLNGDESPESLFKDGINGIDYEYSKFTAHPEWVYEAHELGMSVNVWTVNSEAAIREMVDLGVDCITTNAPELVRTILKEKCVKEL